MSNYLDGYGKETCGHCGLRRTVEGHDGCIGTLSDVMNACCGHGETGMAYVQFWDEKRLEGEKALDYMKCAHPTSERHGSGYLEVQYCMKCGKML